jgi:hypothetical protein
VSVWVNSNQTLFMSWKEAGRRIDRLSALVQNDADYPEYYIEEWQKEVEYLKGHIDNLARATLEHVGK